MREVGQRRQSLGIRLTLLEPIADLLDHLIKRIQSQRWQLLFPHFLAIDVPQGSVLDCLLKRAEPAGARARESPAASGGLTRMGLRSASMPPCRESADCGTIHLRTSCPTHHADISCRIPGEKLDALRATRRCKHRRDPHRSLPPGNIAYRGAARRRRGTLMTGKRVLDPPPSAGGHSRSGREHPARQVIRGRACPCTLPRCSPVAN